MTTDTDPRVQHAIELAGELRRDELAALKAYLAAEFAKVPCIASDPRCPCNDGDTCNYVATKMTPAFDAAHPDATQLISIADLLPTLSGADPAMLANVGHYLRGLSDRVKALPVARTGPLRIAAETASAPVEAVPQMTDVQQISMALQPLGLSILKTATGYKVGKLGLITAQIAPVPRDMAGMLRVDLSVTTPSQAESAGGGAFKTALAVAKLAPSSGRVAINASALLSLDEELSEKFDEIVRLTAELAQANAMCESLAVSVQDLANAKAAVDEAHAIELREVRKDPVIHRGGYLPAEGWYWMRWHAKGPWTIISTYAGERLPTTEWVGPLRSPEAPKP
jgi:hypothetical protein